MPPCWIRQSDKPSRTPRTSQLTTVVEQGVPRWMVEELAEQYFRVSPAGTQVTLYVLSELGKSVAMRIAYDLAKAKGIEVDEAFRRVKQYLGLFIAIVLADHYGPDRIETYRRARRGPNSQRKVPDCWLPKLDWLSCYTPHRLRPGRD